MSPFSQPREIRLQQWEPTIADLSEENAMDILLWGHAKDEGGSLDQKRQLTKRSEKQARQMGDWLRQHAPKTLRILVSPAVRCQQTAEAL